MLNAYEYNAFIQSKIEDALLNDHFYMQYQGKWSVKKERIYGFEALARWKIDGNQQVSPAIFIPIITKSSFMDEFSKLTIRIILTEFQEIQSIFNYEVTISINISPVFFLRNDFESFILNEVDRTSLKHNQIILEITEDIFINDFFVINEKIQKLRSHGIKLSLDDFGSGYSSFNHLNNIDIDELKIDKTLIQQCDKSEKAYILYEMLLSMSKKLNYTVVAEGVETESQAQMMIDSGCDLIQGYYYAHPTEKDILIKDRTY